MGKYLLPITFVLLMTLCFGAYSLLVFELDGSTVTTKRVVR